jgi:hypothetical protein
MQKKEERVLSDRQLASQEKVKELKKALKSKKLSCSDSPVNDEIIKDPHEEVGD